MKFYFLFLFLILIKNFSYSQSSYNFSEVEKVVNDAIKDSAFPGAVVLVSKDCNIQFHKAFGSFTYEDNSTRTDLNSIYDLASLTKVVATTTAAMICIDRNLFSLDDKVSEYITEFASNNKENITIKNLLMHNSGLTAWKKFWGVYDNAEEVLKDIYSSKTEYKPGTKTLYSDLGLITLAKVIEKISGKPFDIFCKEEIFKPLKMNDTYFNPPDSVKDRIPPTEYDNYWRKKIVKGEVHDETSSLLNGVAGHAGLFSTAEDIHNLLLTLLNYGRFEDKQIIDSLTVKLFTAKQPNSSRGLGWDTKSSKRSSAGNYFSTLSFGHTGFTGTSAWVDPLNKVIVVFLTNRVYPTRENNNIIKVRPLLHNAVIKAFQNKR